MIGRPIETAAHKINEYRKEEGPQKVTGVTASYRGHHESRPVFVSSAKAEWLPVENSWLTSLRFLANVLA